jgi:hypothetical protein
VYEFIPKSVYHNLLQEALNIKKDLGVLVPHIFYSDALDPSLGALAPLPED